jgi:ketosteroid isomerase-like protein
VSASDPNANAARIARIFDELSQADVPRMHEFYTEDASFRDPFNDVRGLPEIQRIFGAMYEHLLEPRFHIREWVADQNGAFMVWDMTFRMAKYKPDVVQTIHGGTHLKFATDGRVAYHRDYWDTGEELYAKLPLIGPVVRYLRRKLA